jgi:predicted ArsR family transcriptional regulator
MLRPDEARGRDNETRAARAVHGEVSEELHITPNTVRDHFKAIFDKVGVRSRRELVGQIFAQQYQPRMATGHKPNADGQFT